MKASQWIYIGNLHAKVHLSDNWVVRVKPLFLESASKTIKAIKISSLFNKTVKRVCKSRISNEI